MRPSRTSRPHARELHESVLPGKTSLKDNKKGSKEEEEEEERR
jgi:hypothetical protein